MKHVSIIVPQGDCILSSIIGPYKVLTAANDYLAKTGRKPMFDIHLVGVTDETNLYGGLFSVHPDLMVKDVKRTELVIIPALQPQSLPLNSEFTNWITEQYKHGKQCTTHWLAADTFRQMFPDVDLVPEKIITDEHGIYTSGGAYSFINLVLYLVEKHCGRDVAVFLSKVFEIEIERKSQSPFNIFMGQKDHEDEPIKKAQEYIESNVDKKISVDQLAGIFLISRRNFERRFKKATANTPVEYLQRVKIEAAKKSLESGRENINEVMYAVGYNDSKAFRTTFKKITGLSPLDYRKKYNREIVV